MMEMMMEIENKTVHTPREKGKKISSQPDAG